MRAQLRTAIAGWLTAFGISGAQSVPVTKVMLFSSGVGYFEHAGSVRGNASTELRFKTSQINDILKSLVLQDQDGGRVGAITYPSQDPHRQDAQELPGRHHAEPEPGGSAQSAPRRARHDRGRRPNA